MVFMSSLFKKILNTDWHWILSEKSKICSKCLHLNNLHYANILHYQAVLKTTVFSVQKKKKKVHAFIFWSEKFTELHVSLHSGKLPLLFLLWTDCMLNKPPAKQVFRLNTDVVFIYHLPAKATLKTFHHVRRQTWLHWNVAKLTWKYIKIIP